MGVTLMLTSGIDLTAATCGLEGNMKKTGGAGFASFVYRNDIYYRVFAAAQ